MLGHGIVKRFRVAASWIGSMGDGCLEMPKYACSLSLLSIAPIWIVPFVGSPSWAQVAVQSQIVPLDGRYYVFPLSSPNNRVTGFIVRPSSGNEFSIFGIGQDWAGQGRVEGFSGFYNWRFPDGKVGRTDFRINADGSLQGRAVGSGVDFSFLAKPARPDEAQKRQRYLAARHCLEEVVKAYQPGGTGIEALRASGVCGPNIGHGGPIIDGIDSEKKGRYAEAAAIYQKIIDDPRQLNGNVMLAAERLGYLYAHGRGVRPDVSRAIKLFGAAYPGRLRDSRFDQRLGIDLTLLNHNMLPATPEDVTPELVQKITAIAEEERRKAQEDAERRAEEQRRNEQLWRASPPQEAHAQDVQGSGRHEADSRR